ncbi:hypothetical protein GCM10027615_28060 [Plantactinospora veratri]
MLSDSVVEGPPPFSRLWAEIAPIGRDPGTGGYLRYGFTEPVRELERWFRRVAEADGAHAIEADGNGNLIAWYGPPPERGDAVLLGSHFDSVPYGGGYDGPLGIVSALLAVRALRQEGRQFRRPVGVVAFVEEEGSRFGVPCLGSRLLTGALDPERAAALADSDGVTLAEAMGGRPAGARPELLGRIGVFVELHVEQGRALVDLGAPVGVASGIWPHGRWRLDFAGEANHAGTTRMADRRDPMLTYAFTVLAANKEARLRGAHATIGRVEVAPNATNAIPARVRGWLDARAADAGTLEALVEGTRQGRRPGHPGRYEPDGHPGVAQPAGRVRRWTGQGVPRGARRGRTGAADRRRARRRDPGRARADRDALRAEPDRGVALPAEAATDDDCAEGVRRLADLLAHLAAG